MISVKVVYNNESATPIQELLEAVGNPMFEYFNEDNPKEIKKAWKYKSAAGARQLPFVGVFEDNKLLKAFYAEDNSATGDSFYEWLKQYVEEHAKKGYMQITKLEGKNNETIEKGAVRYGKTDTFIEGVSLILMNGFNWFRTSPIVSIDWEGKTFKTCNSTYSFEFNEFDN